MQSEAIPRRLVPNTFIATVNIIIDKAIPADRIKLITPRTEALISVGVDSEGITRTRVSVIDQSVPMNIPQPILSRLTKVSTICGNTSELTKEPSPCQPHVNLVVLHYLISQRINLASAVIVKS